MSNYTYNKPLSLFFQNGKYKITYFQVKTKNIAKQIIKHEISGGFIEHMQDKKVAH